VRIRAQDDRFTLTVKRGSGLVREEYEVPLEARQFEALWPATEGQRVEKCRHRIGHDTLTIELDVFGGSLAGLVLAEVEFASVEAASAFQPPAWFGAEVTTDGRYTNASLALHGPPDCPPGDDCGFPLS
jgi:CYTH domain-containing protein